MKTFDERFRKVGAICAIVILIVFFALIAWFIGRPMLSLASEPEKFREWVTARGFAGQLIFVCMVFLQVVVAVIPGEPLEIGAGYAFGAVGGTVLCMIGIFLGSITVFYLVRVLGRKLVTVFFPEENLSKLSFLHESPRRDMIFFIIMFIPGTPKDLLSYFAGLTDMKLMTWIIISIGARIPSVVTSTVGGSALGSRNYITAIVVFAVTFVISAAGLIIYNRIAAGKNGNNKQ